MDWHKVLPYVLCGFVSVPMLADFILRGVTRAFDPGKTDFLEVYTGAWLWRHGQNFYDSALATRIAAHFAGTDMLEAIVYPPSAFVLFSPLTFLPWRWANFVCLVLLLVAVLITIFLLIRIGKLNISQPRTLLLIAFTLAFDPIHQAMHLGNISLLVVPLCLAGIYTAEAKHDFVAGFAVALATLLKPQLGLWVLFFYFLQWRVWFMVGVAAPAVPILLALLKTPVPLASMVSSYRQNLQYHFGVGGHLGFTKGALPFHVNISQVVLYQLWPSIHGVGILAHAIFLCGLAGWLFFVMRGRSRIPVPLAISSLIALSFISLYHSVSDVAIFLLLFCWLLEGAPPGEPSLVRTRRLTWLILSLMLLPGHSALMRITPHLSSILLGTWWWNLFVARYFVWLLITLNVVLLCALSLYAKPPNNTDSQSISFA